jgi:hypothetical protein
LNQSTTPIASSFRTGPDRHPEKAGEARIGGPLRAR